HAKHQILPSYRSIKTSTYSARKTKALFTWRTVDRIRSASHWSTGERTRCGGGGEGGTPTNRIRSTVRHVNPEVREQESSNRIIFVARKK
ncbi:unnamed protein product, partial [Nesidiocoris tenuis]